MALSGRVGTGNIVGVAYAIVVARPVSVFVNSQGTGRFDDQRLAEIVQEAFDLRAGIRAIAAIRVRHMGEDAGQAQLRGSGQSV